MSRAPSYSPDPQLFDVVILGFEERPESPVLGLQRVFNVDEATARAVLRALPTAAVRRVNRTRAEHFGRALRSIGARVELFDQNGVSLGAQEEFEVGGHAPANDVLPDSPAHARTMFPGSAATLEAMPAPLPAGRARVSHAPVTAKQYTVPQEQLELEPTAPRIENIAGSPWGTLQREPMKQRPPSQPMAAWSNPDQLRTRPQNLETGGPLLSLEPQNLTAPRLSSRAPAPAPVPSALPALPAAPACAAAAPAARLASRHPARIVAPAAPVVRAAPKPVISRAEDSNFWEGFGEALMFPWPGSGVTWLIGIAIWAVAVNLLGALAQGLPVLNLSVLFLANSSLLAICADYHRRCMWGMANAEVSLEEGPDFDPARILQGYVRSGANVTLFVLVSQIPLVSWFFDALVDDGVGGITLLLSRKFWLLACLPALYWPMAVATASLYNRYSGVWFIPVGLRAIVRAPLEYLAILCVGAFVFLCPWLVCAVLARAAGLPGAFLMAVAGLPLAASHAVMGALTGQLMRAKPDLFK